MKSRLLWALIFAVGNTALYFGLVRPEASAIPKRIRDFLEMDPATQPPIQLPPLVVSESRLRAIPLEPADPGSASREVLIQEHADIDSAPRAPVVNVPDKAAAELTTETTVEIKK